VEVERGGRATGPHVTAAIYAHLVPRAGRTALEEVEDFYGELERPPDEPAPLPARPDPYGEAGQASGSGA
jgi:hypothetical protein